MIILRFIFDNNNIIVDKIRKFRQIFFLNENQKKISSMTIA